MYLSSCLYHDTVNTVNDFLCNVLKYCQAFVLIFLQNPSSFSLHSKRQFYRSVSSSCHVSQCICFGPDVIFFQCLNNTSGLVARHVSYAFLAHLSQRLMGELIVYQSLRSPSIGPSTFSNISALKPLGQLSSKFIWRLLKIV